MHDPGGDASAPSLLSGASFRFASKGAASASASWGRVSRCHPKAAPFSFASPRASSLAASRFAPMISTSSASALLSSQARARRIQLWLTAEMATIALKQEVTVPALDPNAIRSASMNSTAREHENIEELGELSLVLMASASAFWGSRWDVL
jgi:hypothetical protein